MSDPRGDFIGVRPDMQPEEWMRFTKHLIERRPEAEMKLKPEPGEDHPALVSFGHKPRSGKNRQRKPPPGIGHDVPTEVAAQKRVRHLAILSSSLLLVACTSIPKSDIAPPKPDPALCAAVAPEPTLPAGAGIVSPVSDAEKAATQLFLQWGATYEDWARALAARVQQEVDWCRKQ